MRGHLLVPGFIDVHVHGVEGIDTLATADAVAKLAGRFPRYGVTGFCPTTCRLPAARAQTSARRHSARRASTTCRVTPPCIPRISKATSSTPTFAARSRWIAFGLPNARCAARAFPATWRSPARRSSTRSPEDADEVGILTIAPELEGTLDLIRELTAAGHIVSLGHSGATFEQGLAGVDAGGRHATHLFNRMPPFSHRAPGLIGAIFERDEVRAEIVCDGYHVHPVVARTAIRMLGRDRTMAITDGIAAAGLPVGSIVPLGSHTIRAGEEAAFLADGTLAGSTLTMDEAFKRSMRLFRLSEVDAAYICATTPARSSV